MLKTIAARIVPEDNDTHNSGKSGLQIETLHADEFTAQA
jgi:hypothetical protein